MTVEFAGTTEPSGLEVTDVIEQRRLRVRTPTPVTPTPTSTDRFCFPVDTACSIETDSLVFTQRYSVHVLDESGQSQRSLSFAEEAHVGDTTQFIGFDGPLKLYCRVSDPGVIETGIDSIHITFDRKTTVEFGARALHEKPTATIRTPDDHESMMRAISALSSALKTTSPERSWPTLRDHPPIVERGDELDIPSELQPPKSDVTITVPPTYKHLYSVAPLAFYLAADIRASETAAIETPLGRYALDETASIEDEVARKLTQLFLLDCLVRTEGLYSDELRERKSLEEALPFDFATVYEASLPEQLEQYLGVPYDVVEPHIPRWPLTAHVPSTPAGVELLPFILNELGIIREPRGTRVDVSRTEVDNGQFVRSAGMRFARSRLPPSKTDEEESTFIEPAVSEESIEHAWFGPHIPHNASKATIEAYRSRLERAPRRDSIEILLVCNDARMLEEHGVLDETYGTRESLPFDIHSEFGVPTDELATLLTDGGYDFIHYIGHATPEGLQCSDGKLDVRSLSSVDLGVFFLNACQSYNQGLALARRGALGGIVTVSDIINEHAAEIGGTMARLLNLGFPLRATLELTRETTEIGDQYLIVGDGSTDIAQSDGGAPTIVRSASLEESSRVSFQTFSTKEMRIGSASTPSVESITEKHLTPGITYETDLSREELEEYWTWTRVPLLRDNTFTWNEKFSSFERH